MLLNIIDVIYIVILILAVGFPLINIFGFLCDNTKV
jgi:hypothetical protein